MFFLLRSHYSIFYLLPWEYLGEFAYFLFLSRSLVPLSMCIVGDWNGKKGGKIDIKLPCISNWKRDLLHIQIYIGFGVLGASPTTTTTTTIATTATKAKSTATKQDKQNKSTFLSEDIYSIIEWWITFFFNAQKRWCWCGKRDI